MLGVLIFVHELGHFLAFKAIGVKVLKFSLGFPPVMIQRKFGETVYQLGWIPIGGYVSALGETDMEGVASEEDKKRALMSRPPWQRIITFMAGPAMNLALPLLLYWLVFAFPGHELSSRVGMTMEGMPAQAAGIIPGDRIVSVEGRETRYWLELQAAISARPGLDTRLTVVRGGSRFDLSVRPEPQVEKSKLGETRTEGRIGISPYAPEARLHLVGGSPPAAHSGLLDWDLVKAVNGRPVQDWFQFAEAFEAAGRGLVELKVERMPSKAGPGEAAAVRFDSPGTLAGAGIDSAGTYIRRVDPGSPAEAAGISAGDRVVSADGRRILHWGSLESVFRKDPEKAFELVLARGASIYTASVKLQKKAEKDEFKQEYVTWSLGAHNDVNYTGGETVNHGFQPLRAVRESVSNTLEVIRVTYVAVYQLITGKLSIKTVGGPIMIFDMAGTVAKKGAATYLWFMALISINLGIFNLLPVPVLDGGHVLLSLIEAVSRRPLTMRIRMISTYAGLAFLVSMFVLVFKNDIERYWDSIAGFFR
jgi:regulator of sigma E protease